MWGSSHAVTVAKQVIAAARGSRAAKRPRYIGMVRSGLPHDFALNHERYLRTALRRRR